MPFLLKIPHTYSLREAKTSKYHMQTYFCKHEHLPAHKSLSLIFNIFLLKSFSISSEGWYRFVEYVVVLLNVCNFVNFFTDRFKDAIVQVTSAVVPEIHIVR